MLLFACNCSCIIGLVSLVKETFRTCVNHCKNRVNGNVGSYSQIYINQVRISIVGSVVFVLV